MTQMKSETDPESNLHDNVTQSFLAKREQLIHVSLEQRRAQTCLLAVHELRNM